MTKQYETVTHEATKERREVSSTCDLCHETIVGHGFNTDEVTIEYEHDWWFPESKDTKTEAFDLCGKCWKEKLVPWFASQGAAPSIAETNY